MSKDEIGLMRLEIIEKLMVMYTTGTKKNPNHKDDKGDYEIINFIKASLKLLAERNNSPVFAIPDDFIEKFFIYLLEFKGRDQ